MMQLKIIVNEGYPTYGTSQKLPIDSGYILCHLKGSKIENIRVVMKIKESEEQKHLQDRVHE